MFHSQRQRLVAFERKQRHESSTLDRLGNGMLRDCCATGFTTTDNSTVAINQFLKQLNVFVVDVHRTWPFAINVQWIFPRRASFCFRFTTVRFSSHLCQLTGRLNNVQQNWTDCCEQLATKSVPSPAIMQISRVFARHYFWIKHAVGPEFNSPWPEDGSDGHITMRFCRF